MQSWWSRNRWTLYLLVNGGVWLVAIMSLAQGGPLARAAYTVMLVALCSSPVVMLKQFNDRYALLAVFMVIYFVFYGMLDVLYMVGGGPAQPATDGSFTAGEIGILAGGLLLLLGYRAALIAGDPGSGAAEPRDFSKGVLGTVGTLLWLLGSLSWLYFQVFVLSDKGNAAGARGLASLGQTKTFFILLASLLQPVGVLLLAYAYARFRTFGWTALIVAVVFAQICMGFLADIKSSAMLAGIMVIVTKTLVDNRLPRAWLIGAAMFIVVAFPIFQAYRSEITGARGINRTQAAMEIGKVLEIAINSRDKVINWQGEGHAPSFFERSSLKANVERAFDRTGVDVPFQYGRTLLDLPYAFIPRIIFPDKPAVPAGQLFNQQFFSSDDRETYVSPSHLGELYWNFGWLGVLTGMTAIGSMLGFVAARTNLSQGMSLSRLLVLVVTIKGLCMEFEGSIAVAYVIWIRSLAAIGVLHLLFARAPLIPRSGAQESPGEAGPAPVRFPNLMRS